MPHQIFTVEDRIKAALGRLRIGVASALLAGFGAAAAPNTIVMALFLAAMIAACAITHFQGLSPIIRAAKELSNRVRDAELRTEYDARHDPLTGLPNRPHLIEFLDVTMSHAARHGHQVGVCIIDIKGLKRINESYGLSAGDAALKRFARYIRSGTRKGDFIARTGSGEFVIVSAQISDVEELKHIAGRLTRGLRTPFEFHEATMEFGSNSGVVIAEKDQIDPHRLVTDASIALRSAKERDKCCVVFEKNMREAFDAAQKLRAELSDALETGEIKPWFQPQVDISAERRVLGFEALARWTHPERGVLTPIDFFEMADDFGLMERIDEVILEASLDALLEWRREGLFAPQVAVNVSALRLRDPFLTERIKWALESRDLEPSDLCIEVLESVLIEGEDDETAKNLSTLSRIGVAIDLDDFGTGHASISTLKRIKVDRIKIDRSFISNIDNDGEQRNVARTMVDLAHSLGVSALAEGVESDDEFATLSKIECDAAQGFGIARPMPAEAVSQWLRERGDEVSRRQVSA